MATTDLLSLDEARAAINATGDQYDVRLAQLVTAVSTRLAAMCGPIVATATTERHDGGRTAVILRDPPVLSFTSVTEYQGTTSQTLTSETVGTQPSYGYLWDDQSQALFRRSGGSDLQFYPGRMNIVIVYSAGRAATTALVPERFKEAASIIVAHAWRTERGSGNQTFGQDGEFRFSSFSIPNRAMELIAQDRRPPGIA